MLVGRRSESADKITATTEQLPVQLLEGRASQEEIEAEQRQDRERNRHDGVARGLLEKKSTKWKRRQSVGARDEGRSGRRKRSGFTLKRRGNCCKRVSSNQTPPDLGTRFSARPFHVSDAFPPLAFLLSSVPTDSKFNKTSLS